MRDHSIVDVLSSDPTWFEQRIATRLAGYPDPTSCWTWTAAISKGYGVVRLPAGPTVLTHRAAWLALVGPIPVGLVLDHDGPDGCQTVRTRIGTAAPAADARPDIAVQIGVETVQVVLEAVDPAEVVAEQERLGAEARERLADFWHGGRAQRAEYARQAKSRERMTRFVRARLRAAKPSMPAGYDVEKLLRLLEDEDTPDELLHLVAMLWQAHPRFRDEWKV